MTFYLKLWVNLEIFIIFFRKISEQMTKVIAKRLLQPKISTVAEDTLCVPHDNENFLRKIRELRSLYMDTVYCFAKFCGRMDQPMKKVILLGYGTTIAVFGIVIICLREHAHFDILHYGVLIRFVAIFLYILLIMSSFSRIEICVSIHTEWIK